MADDDLNYRKEIARELLSANEEESDYQLKPDPQMVADAEALAANLGITFPANLGPVPKAIAPEPDPTAALPQADVVVVTWTIDEVRALADVLTPGFVREKWYRYSRNWAQFDPKIRRGAPSKAKKFLGTYFVTQIGNKKVLCFKSELHLNQDGIRTGDGTATLPVKDLFHQIIDEAKPKLVITTGTAGAVSDKHDLGDVVMTRAALFRLNDEFKNEAFNKKKFQSDWSVPTARLQDAIDIMATFKNKLEEHPILPPTVNYNPQGVLTTPSRPNAPDIKRDDSGDATMPKFHPILTTDFFEFGTSKNKLDDVGGAVEMGDAVLGLAIEERKGDGRSTPNWLVIRNCSDPQINGDLYHQKGNTRQSLQVLWAVYYYKGYGYWTSVMSALATWGVIAGLP